MCEGSLQRRLKKQQLMLYTLTVIVNNSINHSKFEFSLIRKYLISFLSYSLHLLHIDKSNTRKKNNTKTIIFINWFCFYRQFFYNFHYFGEHFRDENI